MIKGIERARSLGESPLIQRRRVVRVGEGENRSEKDSFLSLSPFVERTRSSKYVRNFYSLTRLLKTSTYFSREQSATRDEFTSDLRMAELVLISDNARRYEGRIEHHFAFVVPDRFM